MYSLVGGLLLFLSGFFTQAQQVWYDYDDAGNRIRRYAVPDLTPTIDIDGLQFAEGTNLDFVLNVYEINNVTTFGPISLRISKLPSFNITYPKTNGTANVFGGIPVENGNWDFSENANFISVNAKPGVSIAANGLVSIGFTIGRKPSVAGGVIQNLTAVVVGGSGGEKKTDNNIVIVSVIASN